MISNKRKFIFVHIPKTAGTSISEAIRDIPGCNSPRVSELFEPRSSRVWRFRKHEKATGYRAILGDKLFDQYYSFAVVRNPWDMMVSSYHWWVQKAIKFDAFKADMNQGLAFSSFTNFIQSEYGSAMINEFRGNILDWISDDWGRIIVNKVCKFETLNQDWQQVCVEAGLPYKPLPRKNPTKRKPYQEYYDNYTRDLIAWRFQKEINLFGYEF